VSRATTITILAATVAGSAIAATRLVRWATRWGSNGDEQAAPMPGDSYLDGGPPGCAVMTRAVSIPAPPRVVWPWLAQMGRGAGWYSYDRIDNAGKGSARHIVSWIPAPRVGDATAVGWLRRIEPGRALTWWLPGDENFVTTMRMVIDIRLDAEDAGSRLVIRVSGDATGMSGAIVIGLFQVVDSIMAIRQLQGIRARADAFGARTSDPAVPETGERDQFQLYEAIWASGGGAGSPGSEKAALWRKDAEAAGAVSAAGSPAAPVAGLKR
jgi:hypothetical protein